ncbi:MAG: hypothetical protein ABI650_10100, partial [Dokdonella sp.]
MRIGIAALIGAIILFCWQFASHMLLPIGEMGFIQPQNEDIVIAAVAQGAPQPGIYTLPYIDSAKMDDQALTTAWIEKAKANRFSFIVVSDPQPNALDMTANLAKQFVASLLGALIVAMLLAATAWGFGARVLGSAA